MSSFGIGGYENPAPVYPAVASPRDVDVRAAGMEKIGGNELSANALSLTVGPFEARDALLIHFRVPAPTSMVIACRFNGVVAAGSYWHRNFSSTYLAAGIASFTDSPSAAGGATMMVLEGEAAATNARTITMSVVNRLENHKVCSWSTVRATAAAGTAPVTQIGSGAWVNTTAQITSVTLISVAGNVNFAADTGIGVYGGTML